MTVYGLAGYPWYEMLESCYFFKNAEHKKAFYESDIAKELFDTVADELGVRYLAYYNDGYRTVNLNIDRKATWSCGSSGCENEIPK